MDPRNDLRKPAFGLGGVFGRVVLVARRSVGLGDGPVRPPYRRETGAEGLLEGVLGGYDRDRLGTPTERRLREHQRAVHHAIAPPARSTRGDDG